MPTMDENILRNVKGQLAENLSAIGEMISSLQGCVAEEWPSPEVDPLVTRAFSVSCTF
jgi:hypothetical protein